MNKLIDILINQEIIFQGKNKKEDLMTTPHFRLLEAIIKKNGIDYDEAKKLVEPNSLKLILFSLKGDGLIVEENNVIEISEKLNKLL